MNQPFRVDHFKASSVFIKALRRLPKKDRDRVQSSLHKATVDLADPTLRFHRPKGPLAGFVSIDAGWDLRIHCRIRQEDQLTWAYLVAVGTHSQLYG